MKSIIRNNAVSTPTYREFRSLDKYDEFSLFILKARGPNWELYKTKPHTADILLGIFKTIKQAELYAYVHCNSFSY